MENEISLSEVLEILNRKDKNGAAFPFDIAVRTLNKNSKTGGKLNVYKGAKLLVNENKKGNGSTRVLDNVLVPETFKKNPNHWNNRTRNIMLADGNKRKIHLRLIDSINNKKMVY